MPNNLRIVQAVFGVFHHFELAREMDRRGHLTKIYSTFPWQRVRREGLPKEKVETFPWLHVPEILMHRYGVHNRWLHDQVNYANAIWFDEWTHRRVPECDAFVAIAGAGLKTGKLVQQRGGKFICDRGSSHVRHRAELIAEEEARWGAKITVEDPRDIVREEAIYDQADGITVPSTYAKRTYIERGIAADKIHQIPYGVLLDRFAKVAEPPKDTFEVLYVGRVSLPKGTPYLLQAFAKLPVKNKRLTIVGGVLPEFQPILATLPQENVTFVGPVPQATLKERMSRSHVMVMPSLDEGMALVQGQALACGCPVIGTTDSGAEDLLTEGEDGFIVPVRDVDALVDRMQRIADNPLLQKEMSRKAEVKVHGFGGWQLYGDRWEHLLRRMIAGKEEL